MTFPPKNDTENMCGVIVGVILVEGDPVLFNPYGVLPVSAEAHPGVNADLAGQFVTWLISLETQELIASFEVNGEQLFYPDLEQWRAEN